MLLLLVCVCMHSLISPNDTTVLSIILTNRFSHSVFTFMLLHRHALATCHVNSVFLLVCTNFYSERVVIIVGFLILVLEGTPKCDEEAKVKDSVMLKEEATGTVVSGRHAFVHP